MTDKRTTTYTAEEIEAMAARYARSNGHADVAVMLYSLADQQEIIAEGKRQWDQVAALLGADGDNVDDVLRKAQPLSVPEGWKLARDAERYRWLRDAGNAIWKPLAKRYMDSCALPTDVDQAIDAAIKEQRSLSQSAGSHGDDGEKR